MGPWANPRMWCDPGTDIGLPGPRWIPWWLGWEEGGRGKPTSVNPIGFVLVSFTGKFTSILTSITSKFADNHRIDCM